jgi:hypothetical protein
MKAHPDEHHALEQIAALLRAAEPHLAAMFSIFTRLTAHEGPPPDEDRFGPVRRPGRRTRRDAGPGGALAAAGPTERASTLRAVLIPTLLLAMIVVIITVALSGTGKCTAPDRASVFAYQSAHVSACAQASTKKAAAGHP